jgi:hypothetical protein
MDVSNGEHTAEPEAPVEADPHPDAPPSDAPGGQEDPGDE